MSKELNYEEQLKKLEWLSLRDSVLRKDKQCTCHICNSSTKKINVHHRYYIYGHMAWEYCREALVPLCVDCHNLIHDTIEPLIYYEEGTTHVSLNLTPCFRCGGRGYFEEYKNIANGICFRCRGTKFEELIDGETQNICQYIERHTWRVADCIHYKYDLPLDKFDISEIGLDKDITIGYKEVYEEAVQGNPMSQFKWAEHCLSMVDKLPKDYYKIVLRFLCYAAMPANYSIYVRSSKELLKETAYKAQLKIADVLYEGILVPKNEELAEKWKSIGEKNKAILLEEFERRGKAEKEVKELLEKHIPGEPLIIQL